MLKDTFHGCGRDVSLFEKGQVIGMHQAEQTSKEIVETIKIGLRTVQCIIKNWTDSGEPLSSRKKCGQKKFLIDQDWRPLKCLVKSNRRKTTLNSGLCLIVKVRTFPHAQFEGNSRDWD